MTAGRYPELAFQADVVRILGLAGWGPIHHETDSRRTNPGFLDLLAIHREAGRLLVAELKVGRNALTVSRLRRGRLELGQRDWFDAWFSVACAERFIWYPRDWAEIIRVAWKHDGSRLGRLIELNPWIAGPLPLPPAPRGL